MVLFSTWYFNSPLLRNLIHKLNPSYPFIKYWSTSHSFLSNFSLPLKFQTRLKMSKANNLKQPPWKEPTPNLNQPLPQLKLYNSLTRKKETFIPSNGRQVTWYNCGPTVYDAAHIGHARLYLSVDIMRRILQDYFNYNIRFVMNITDIDDKIILRARQSHLYETFLKQHQEIGLSSTVYEQIYKYWKDFVARQFGDVASETWATFYAKAIEKTSGDVTTDAKLQMNLKLANTGYETLMKYKNDPCKEAFEKVTQANQSMISASLDHAFGATVTDHTIFRNLASYWEQEFMKDMKELNVRPPGVLTRVSEYVPEIIQFVQRILEKGFAYEVDGSVYFDTTRFHTSPNHVYAKLEPWSANSEKLIAEGEGDLSNQLTTQKKATADFALWKRSKEGEPSWPSPWGPGRPGWHIECSVMASEVLGEKLDIHTGGIDLAFPHHDNELAQSEACFSCDQWVNYFLHVGHLHVEGQKMSKSLKNFTTIREALNQYSPNTLRLLVLQQHWQGIMDFKASTMQQVQATEQTFIKFSTLINAILGKEELDQSSEAVIEFSSDHQFHDKEKHLMAVLSTTESDIYSALCDNLNTPLVIEKLLHLISETHVYLNAIQQPNTYVLRAVAEYVTHVTKVFGLTYMGPSIGYGHNSSKGLNEIGLMPYLQVLSTFRDQVRTQALTTKDSTILKLCDELRDVILPKLNVILDDRDDGALIKLVDSDYMNYSGESKLKKQEAQHQAKLEQARQTQIKKLEKLYAGRIAPKEMFLLNKEYSAFDEQGLPTLDQDGQPLAKSRLKKLMKESTLQAKLHETYLAEKEKVDWTLLKEAYEAEGKTWVPPS